jgi:hypothetical protein
MQDIPPILNSDYLKIAAIVEGVTALTEKGICPSNPDVLTKEEFVPGDVSATVERVGNNPSREFNYPTKEKDVAGSSRGGICPRDEMDGAGINRGIILSLT